MRAAAAAPVENRREAPSKVHAFAFHALCADDLRLGYDRIPDDSLRDVIVIHFIVTTVMLYRYRSRFAKDLDLGKKCIDSYNVYNFDDIHEDTFQ